ncbi:hypothetical protein EFK50_15245 [Nocardioides marmoriginsengisoli]|uniref:3-hydroxyacyl-CoA dehydrogenase n=1 Tax=Nocardioides marmoriginsengisoli TaxID=661483 RepID=A0A3N0CHV5_9ACTN|nr:Rv3235 family protein [Nocardioides marmoriginsengisoli]RNL63067.1 hypothetical protein EFK50_15245 [Nocardioides marmoriginsengisoli]
MHSTPQHAAIPIAPAQGLLALDFNGATDIPIRPNLKLVTSDEPELDAFATRFSQAVVEVIGGDRGVHQLMRWTTDTVYEDLQLRCNALHRTTPQVNRRHRLRAHVRSVHLSRPHPEAAEISIHVRHGDRSRAIAARIELIERRWRCTDLEFG